VPVFVVDSDCVATSARKMYVCVSRFVGRYPFLNARARTVDVALIVIGPVYIVPLISVGSVPSSVYRIVAPGVVVVIASGNDAV
jgi:hypothetical protein